MLTILSHQSVASLAGYEPWLKHDTRAAIYATSAFHDFLAAATGTSLRHLIAEEAGQIAGALSYGVARREGLGALVNSLPWYGSHGGCVGARDAQVRRALLEQFRAEALTPDVLSATLVLTPSETSCVPEYVAALAPCVGDDRIGQVTAVPAPGPDLDRRLAAVLTKKTRNVMRKSLQQGFVERVRDDDDAWAFLHATHAENIGRIGGRAKPRAHFDALRRHIPPAWRRLSVATLDGTPVAAMLLVAFHRTVEYITPVIVHRFRPLQPLSFLIWHGLMWAAECGFGHWNWGGTWRSQESLRHFKAGWGAQDEPYAYVTHADESGLARIHERRQEIAAAFPYYYCYPNALLDGPWGRGGERVPGPTA